jgi:photosynthetic reaction center H subunit
MSAFYEIDIAFISLCLFALFFASLIFYLRREDRREGYPLEEEGSGRSRSAGGTLIPTPKTFRLPGGHGTATAPNFKRDERPLAAKPVSVAPGSPLEPTGNPLVDGVGPAAYAERAKTPDRDMHGRPKIVPMRIAEGFSIARGDKDPRGMKVIGADGVVAGTVADVWVDRPESMIRYLEVSLAAGGRKVLAPMPMALIKDGRVVIDAITAAQFADVPGTASADQVTLYEEDRISGYYGGGYLYAKPSRMEPLL